MTARIFISYSSKDSEIAKFIHAELEKRGADVFIDYRSIDDGDDFYERIAREVEERDRVLFLVSQHSVTSKWVRIELQHAFENNKAITPIALDDTPIPRPLFFVGKLHRRAFERSDEYMTRLCSVLGIANQTPLPPASSIEPPAARTAIPPPPPMIKRKTSLDLMPQPFAWIDIKGKKWTAEPYQIAKYPVTNAQYKVFVDAGGYQNKQWWGMAGWAARRRGEWAFPRYWTNQDFNGADQPVVGVSWFESVAFCLWLSDVTGKQIMLPTEDQWQYAAQGDDQRAYPWDNTWEDGRCNTDESKVGKTTPVRQYEGKGDSPFRVVDMFGNVFEWCATDYQNKSNDITIGVEYRRVVRGICLFFDLSGSYARAVDRNFGYPSCRYFDQGFRVARS